MCVCVCVCMCVCTLTGPSLAVGIKAYNAIYLAAARYSMASI